MGGKYSYTNGATYQGEFKHDERHGRGTYTLSDGRVYAGDCRHDLHHGHGKLTYPPWWYPPGLIQEGHFRAGKYVERCKCNPLPAAPLPAGSCPWLPDMVCENCPYITMDGTVCPYCDNPLIQKHLSKKYLSSGRLRLRDLTGHHLISRLSREEDDPANRPSCT